MKESFATTRLLAGSPTLFIVIVILVLSYSLTFSGESISRCSVLDTKSELYETVFLDHGFYYDYYKGSGPFVDEYFDDLLLMYRYDSYLFKVEDYLIIDIGVRENCPTPGYASVFVVSWAGGNGAYGTLSIVTFDDNEILSIQKIELDAYPLLRFEDATGDGIEEILVHRRFGVRWDIPMYRLVNLERLALWRDNKWVADSIGEFPEFYLEKATTARDSIAHNGGISDMIFFIYYSIMSGIPQSSIIDEAEALVAKHTLILDLNNDEIREPINIEKLVLDLLRKAIVFNLESS